MSTRISKPRTQKSTRRQSTEIHEDSRTNRRRIRAQELQAELDEILDDIDEALQGVHEETALNFKQKGGQ